MSDPLIMRQDANGIATLTLNAPASLNALSMPMLQALDQALAALAGDASVRVVVLKGAGRAFCAGHDLKEMQAARALPDQGRAYFKRLFDLCAQVMQRIPPCPSPSSRRSMALPPPRAASWPRPATLSPRPRTPASASTG